MTFLQICTFAVLYKAYLAARRGKRSRAATAHYEVHLLENIVNLIYILKTKIYRPGLFRVFYVFEPKKRLVQAPAFVDKVVQHAIVDNLLYERITRSFILDNYASQKGKGLHFGLDRLRGFFIDYWRKYHTTEGWVLKCDVRHFFASIDHDRLKAKLQKLGLEPIVYDLLCVYIDCSDGLPLGYQTSQLFALLFLDEFDHFVKEKLRIRYYGRYMDDLSSSAQTRNTCNTASGKSVHIWQAWTWSSMRKPRFSPCATGLTFLAFTPTSRRAARSSASCGIAASSGCGPSSGAGSGTTLWAW